MNSSSVSTASSSSPASTSPKIDFKPASPFLPKDQSPGPTPARHFMPGQVGSSPRREGGALAATTASPPPEKTRRRPTSRPDVFRPGDSGGSGGENDSPDTSPRLPVAPPIVWSASVGEVGGAAAPSCQALKHAVSTLYRIDDFHLEKIGAGFFSEVFKVTHKTTGKIMVLKMNKQRSNRNNMLKEVQLMNKLNHPNILRFEAACVHEGQLHALTEFINAGNLEQLIQDRAELLPWSVRMSLALDTAKGLAYLHATGMFHRDLTSKNILVKRSLVLSSPSPSPSPSPSCPFTAVVGDFGLAARIPKKGDFRLPQVGSPYWMSPECLRGKFYDQRADVFSFGIILCELIGRLDADPDVLPRTENFGVDYIAFSALCQECPPNFLTLAFNCVRIAPQDRPTAKELSHDLDVLHEKQKREEARASNTSQMEGKIILRKVGHKRSLSAEEDPVLRTRDSPSERARFHFKSAISAVRLSSTQLAVLSVGKEMSLLDPDYRPTPSNPFSTLPRLREGRKILGSSRDLFSSCFELPSPKRGATPTGCRSMSGADDADDEEDEELEQEQEVWRFGGRRGGVPRASHSLPPSPTTADRRPMTAASAATAASTWSSTTTLIKIPASASTSRFEDHLFHGRVQLLKRLYSGGNWMTQDDSVVEMSSRFSSDSLGASCFLPAPLRRRGSCESGFHSVGTAADDFWFDHSGMSSTRSMGSSLLTVSDLEEDLRAASVFLNKRASSVLTDSNDDLVNTLGLEQLPKRPAAATATLHNGERGYEKDIRDIVAYFEASCRMMDRRSQQSAMARSGVVAAASYQRSSSLFMRQQQQQSHSRGSGSGNSSGGSQSQHLPRSQKIDSLIKRVVEKESRDRLRSGGKGSLVGVGAAAALASQKLQVCDGIVRSKLLLFDHTKRTPRSKAGPYDQKGSLVKSKLAIFDGPPTQQNRMLSSSCQNSSKKIAERRLAGLLNSQQQMQQQQQQQQRRKREQELKVPSPANK